MLGRGIAVASLTLLAAAVPWAGASETPAPGCAGSWADEAGDWSTSTQSDPANLDILEFWFDTRDGETTANLRVADLSTTPPPNSDTVRWRVRWKVGEAEYYVMASGSGKSPLYQWGDASGGSLDRRGSVAGRFFPGPRGVIQWPLPAETKAPVLGAPLAETEYMTSSAVDFIAIVDNAAGADHTVAECAAGAPVPPPAAPPGTAPAPAPAPAPAGSAPAPATPAAPVLDVRAPRLARLPRRGSRSLTLRLRSQRGVRALGATLFRGTRRVGSGALPTLGRDGRLRIGIAGKGRLRPGRYTLRLTGFNADSTAARATFTVRLR
jgi:hypothetical protein